MTFLTAMPSEANKHLVLIVGARQQGLQEFFYQFAAGLETGTERSESLHGWRWPIIREEDLDLLLHDIDVRANVSRYNVFDLLFRKKNDGFVQEVLMEAIRSSWENSTDGIILGEERFDKVGVNPFTSDDALKTIFRLMENLSIRPKDVTVVLLYGNSRTEQWASIWHEHSTYDRYKDFICEDNETDLRFEYIDTTLNPFKLATVYRQHGWNVVILDEEGVSISGLDPAHAIACNILGVSCDEGQIIGLKEEISRPPPTYEINELDEDDKHELEQLFLLRDCCYKEDLELQSGTKEFYILNEKSIWKNCRNQCNFELRDKINDVNFFSNVIQSQLGCEREFVDMSDMLASRNIPSFGKLLWPIIIGSIFFIASVFGVLLIREKQKNNIKNELSGLFHDTIFGRRKSGNTTPPDRTDRSKYLCNACKFVRFDPNCIFCYEGRRVTSSEIGKEVERRIKQHQRVVPVGVSDEVKDYNQSEVQEDNDRISGLRKSPELCYALTSLSTESAVASSNMIDPNHVGPSKCTTSINFLGDECMDTSHFDMNLRKTKSQSKKRRNKEEEQKQNSKVVRKLKELLVLKTENGDKVHELKKPSGFFSGDNLQTISFEENDNIFV